MRWLQLLALSPTMNTKRKYRVYRDDSSEDENLDVAHSRMVSLSANRRRQLIMQSSPTKLRPEGVQSNGQTGVFMENWEPTLGMGADWNWSEDEHSEHDSQEIIVKPLVKRYTASVSHWARF